MVECVIWRSISASVVGTSHTTSGTDCQDSCIALSASTDDQPDYLFICVADGAGSSSHGGNGAELAIESSAKFINSKLASSEINLDTQLSIDCVTAVRDSIHSASESLGLTMRDFACTYLGVLVVKSGTLVMQIGDGGIVVDFGTGLQVPIIPMSGEYANMTNFITDENAFDVLESKLYPDVPNKVAVFTDGIQRLALNMASNEAHEPFFSHFFDILAAATVEQEDQLETALVNFLSSDSVNERTDDDKTLALAINMYD